MGMLAKLKIKYIQSLSQKKFRDAGNVFIAEGPKIVKELIEADPAQLAEVFAVKEWIDDNVHLLDNTVVVEITGDELNKISQLTTPSQVVAIVKKFDENILINTS